MRVILIDDEQSTLDELSYLFLRYPEFEIAEAFLNPIRAIGYVEELARQGLALPDVVFLDIDMPQRNGLDTALELRGLHPDIIIIFVTAYSSYALESFRVHPLDYLLKPIKQSQFDAAAQHIKKQVGLILANRQSGKRPLRVTCFGRFRMDAGDTGREIKWGTRRVRELFLYLIDCRGAPVGHDDLTQVLFGDDSKKNSNNLYVTVHMLRDLLNRLDPNRDCFSLGKDCALRVAPGVCDYIDFMNFAEGNAMIGADNAAQAAAMLGLYGGDYLEDVDAPWVAMTAGAVDAEYERIALSLCAVYASGSNSADAVETLRRLIARNPLSEDGHMALLDLYLKEGRREDFLAAYEQYARILKTELGEKPPARYTRHYLDIKPQ